MRGGIATGKLTDKAIKAFVAKADIGRKLADGGGLYLFITQAGNPTWRIKYRLDGREKVYSIGPYPLISLAAARLEWGEVKAKILAGKDPVDSRRLARVSRATAAGHTVEVVAGDWLNMKRTEWSETHHVKSAQAFERDVFPLLGKLPISAVTLPWLRRPFRRFRIGTCWKHPLVSCSISTAYFATRRQKGYAATTRPHRSKRSCRARRTAAIWLPCLIGHRWGMSCVVQNWPGCRTPCVWPTGYAPSLPRASEMSLRQSGANFISTMNSRPG